MAHCATDAPQQKPRTLKVKLIWNSFFEMVEKNQQQWNREEIFFRQTEWLAGRKMK